MGTAVERVRAFRDALSGVGATSHRMPHTTPEAVTLARELDPAKARHPTELAASLATMAKIAELPQPNPDDEAGLRDYLNTRERARVEFWDAFEGETVEGVEIVRRAGL